MIPFSRIISHLFHPLLMPLAGIFIIFNLPSYISFSVVPEIKNVVYLVTLIFTLLLPVFNVLFLRWRGAVKSLQLETKQERILPLLLTAVSFGMAYYFLTQIPLPAITYRLVLGAVLISVAVFAITFFTKISIHMAGTGGLLGVLIAMSDRIGVDLTMYIVIFALCTGLTGVSRLALQSHTPFEVYSGFCLGMGCTMGCIYF